MALQSIVNRRNFIRLQNMAKWNRKDFDFYGNFFKELDLILSDDSDLIEYLKEPETETADEKWARFLKFQKALKIKMN